MKKFGNFNDVIEWTKTTMYNYCYEVHTEKWQGKTIKDDDRFRMIEILLHSFSCVINPDLKVLQEQIKPNLPWADDHFEERVGGLPLNPPPSHNWWPFAQKNNAEFGGNEKFSHTYPERMWPKFASETPNSKMEGVRYEYGDFLDVLNLIRNEPFTRQAFLPIWFPEDTGVTFHGRVPCFTAETEIQTRLGYKKISEITLDDEVITHLGRYRKVEKIFKSRYEKSIYTINTSNTNNEINSTEDHPFLIIRNKGLLPSHSNFEWKEEWINSSDLIEGDYVVHSFIGDTINPVFSEDLMRLFGYYLAEGDISFDKRYENNKPCCVRFSMSSEDEENGYIKDIIDIIWKEFKRIPIIRKAEDKNNPNSIRIYFHNVEFAKLIYSIFGTGSYNKIIPESILKYPKAHQFELLCGYTRGDGSFEPGKKNLECTSVSPSIIMGLRIICLRNGIYNSLQKIPLRAPYYNKLLNRIIKPNYSSYKLVFSQGGRLAGQIFNVDDKNPRDVYRKDWFKDNRVLFQINKINIKNPEPIDVYNLQVNEDNSYNLINCTVHNCTIGYHFIRRGNHLHVVYYIRSCDFFRHFRDDIYMCARKVLWLLERLRELDPEEWNDVEPGLLTMHITSLHAFAHEKNLLKK